MTFASLGRECAGFGAACNRKKLPRPLSRQGGASLSILVIILIVIVVLALLGFFGFRGRA
jgi:hypothetical protein